MATFGSWLEAQAGRGDDIGLAARAWQDAAGSRPKASAIKTIADWLVSQGVEGLADDRVEPVMVAAANEYRAGKATAAVAAIPGAVLPEGSAGSVMAALDRLEGKLDAIWARLGPQAALEHTPEFSETLRQAGHDLRGEAAQGALDGLPQDLPGPAPAVALYGQHVVPEPDWQRLSDEGVPEPEAG